MDEGDPKKRGRPVHEERFETKNKKRATEDTTSAEHRSKLVGGVVRQYYEAIDMNLRTVFRIQMSQD